MKRCILALVVLCALPSSAQAYSCADVRAWLAGHSWAEAIVFAKRHMTAEQRRQALACLRNAARK